MQVIRRVEINVYSKSDTPSHETGTECKKNDHDQTGFSVIVIRRAFTRGTIRRLTVQNFMVTLSILLSLFDAVSSDLRFGFRRSGSGTERLLSS